jgi:hypothetical protein
MRIAVLQIALSLVAIILWAGTALARSALTCVTKQAIMVDTSSGSRAAQTEEHDFLDRRGGKDDRLRR